MVSLDNIRDFVIEHPGGYTLFGNAEEFNALPATHRDQILFLDKSVKKYLYSFTGPSANLLTGDGYDPFAKGNFKTVEEFTELHQTDEGRQKLKKWLYQRGIPFSTWVFVLYDSLYDPVLVTWKMVIKYSNDIFFGQDVVIFDHTQQWCLSYYHENEMYFGKDPFYDPTENEQKMQALNERKKNYPGFRHPYL